ncbi:hypothetical protein; putative membrane protein [Herminiimonas arsenicoxydans]|uniref:Uncharacterized protein n=1 Tax=Herminiimonas arsenicoxydans TaxID=204773 RepID=A4G2X4_HERAR|nr:hypothetical protein; putative membrane protein [Herminiimonas arsenicoxydans]
MSSATPYTPPDHSSSRLTCRTVRLTACHISPTFDLLRTVAHTSMIHYLSRLSLGRTVLWCYFIWYSLAIVWYFDPSTKLWLTSIGIGTMMGFGLLFSTTDFPFAPTNLGRWQIFRFFFMPFCVSSFSSIVKGHGFTFIFFPTFQQTVIAVTTCATFCMLVVSLKGMKKVTS